MKDRTDKPTRRGFLLAGGGVLAAGAANAMPPAKGNPANQPPNVPDWSRSLGDRDTRPPPFGALGCSGARARRTAT